MDAEIARFLGTTPLYAGLAPHEIDELAAGTMRRCFDAGETLMVQGAPADGAYTLLSGRVRIVRRLPGGGEAIVAELGPGDFFGEMSLMRGGRRSASARADGLVEALFADRRHFAATLNLLRPASLNLLRRLGLIVAGRLRDVRERSVAQVQGELVTRPAPMPAGGEALVGFDVRAFLPVLPCFREMDREDLDRLFAAGAVVHPRRGEILARAGERADACRLVVRGAAIAGALDGDRLQQLDVIGPGRFCETGPLLTGRPLGADIVAGEDSTLLSFDPDAFLGLWSGNDRFNLRLIEAVNAGLAQALDVASAHLTRMSAQSRVAALAAAAA